MMRPPFKILPYLFFARNDILYHRKEWLYE